MNGVLEGAKAEAPFTDTHSANLRIGSTLGEGANLDGLVDEIDLYDRPLSSAEIQAIFDAGIEGKPRPMTPRGTLSLSIADVAAGEAAGAAVLTISVDGTTSTAVTAQYSTFDGTANAPDDYTATSKTVTIPANQRSTSVHIQIVDDSLAEPDENFTVVLSNPSAGTYVSGSNGTATVTILDDEPLRVNSNNDADDGACDAIHCSLREAIEDANTGGGATITFNIQGDGPHTIRLLSPLPFTNAPVAIDGYTQPGAGPNTSAPGVASNAVLKIELDGTNAGTQTDGLVILGGNSTVRGLAINRFDRVGIWIEGPGGNTIQGNYVGTNVAGTSGAGNGAAGVLILDSPGNQIGGTNSETRNVISGNGSGGVEIEGSGSTGNVAQGNFIGTDASGTLSLPNTDNGVLILNAPSNTIGGTVGGARNLISGNGFHGISIALPLATGNSVQGNFVGTDTSGTSDLGNAVLGIGVFDASNNMIGGTAAGAGNIISGNDASGVWISRSEEAGGKSLNKTGVWGKQLSRNRMLVYDRYGVSHPGFVAVTGRSAPHSIQGAEPTAGLGIASTPSSGNKVLGNLIGTDASGSSDLGNSEAGVVVARAAGNTIGGTQLEARNVISGNENNGIFIFGQTATGNLVQGNFIGVDASGSFDLGNTRNGVVISDGSGNTIGGTAVGARNVISGNDIDGVAIQAVSATGNLVQGNLIGTDVTGTNNVGNGQDGVFVVDSSGNSVGGPAGASNTIAFNGAGVRIRNFEASSVGNAILSNSMFSNAALGIDLHPELGRSPNDPSDVDSGANNLQNFPVISRAEINASGDLVIEYNVDSATENSSYPLNIEFFRADTHGEEGERLLGSDSYQLSEAQSFTVVNLGNAGSLGVQGGEHIVATATDAGNNTSEFSDNLTVPEADLSITKVDSPDQVIAGTNLQYILSATNNGPSDATGVTLTVTLPAGVVLDSATPTQGSCSESGGTVTCNLGGVGAGASASSSILVAVDPSTRGTITNTASVSASEPDPDASNNSATQDTTVNAQADLSITKADSPDPVIAGINLQYILSATNNGPSDATGVTLTDTLPAGVVLDSATPTQGSCSESGGTVTCNLGGVGAGASASSSILVAVDPSTRGTITNTASVSASEPDPDASNNSATQDTTVNAQADLSITKADSPDPVIAGINLQYILSATNNGPSDATGVTLTDTLPAGVVLDSATPTQGSCSESGGTVTCNLGGVGAGASASSSILVAVDPSTRGTITNTASVSASEPDPDASNNSATRDTTVNAQADLSITKADSPDPAIVGRGVGYELVVINHGPSDATGVTLTDDLPPGVTYESAGVSQGKCAETGAVVTCELGTIPIGGSATTSLWAEVDAGRTGLLNNSSTVAGLEPDADATNSVALAITQLAHPSVDQSLVPPSGEDVVYSPIRGAQPAAQEFTPTRPSLVASDILVWSQGPDEENVTVTVNIRKGSVGSSIMATASRIVSGHFVGLLHFELPSPLVVAHGDRYLMEVQASAPTVSWGHGGDGYPGGSAVMSGSAQPETDWFFQTYFAEVDLSLAIMDSEDPVLPGNPVAYALSVTNHGPSRATGITVTAALPAGVTFDSATEGCTEDSNANIVECSLGDLASGATASAAFGVTIVSSTSSSILQTAVVAAKEPDANAANDWTVQETKVVPTIVEIPVTTGLNLIGAPIRFLEATRPSDLARQIAERGGELAQVVGWNAGTGVFRLWSASSPGANDFELQEGHGYFILMVSPPATDVWRSGGLPVGASVPLELLPGLNLITAPFLTPPGGYDTVSFAQAIAEQGGQVAQIAGWDAAAQRYSIWSAAAPESNVFGIDPGSGYFVLVAEPTPQPFEP